MTREQAMVREFHEHFGLAAPNRPDLAKFPAGLRVRLIQEEASEFASAAANGDLVGMIDAVCDLLYVTYGAAVALGVDLEPFFAEVHRTNMLKAGHRRRQDGKVLKQEDWEPPRLREILKKRYRVAVTVRSNAETSERHLARRLELSG